MKTHHWRNCELTVTVTVNTMGNCLYLLHKNSDMNEPTFSHYSLNSSSSYLDLYPSLRYMEADTVSQRSEWRRSSAPLLDSESGSSYYCAQENLQHRSGRSKEWHMVQFRSTDYQSNFVSQELEVPSKKGCWTLKNTISSHIYKSTCSIF